MIDQIKETLDKATGKGEWSIGKASPNGLQNVGYKGLMVCQTFTVEDAELISNATKYIKYLLGEVEQLTDKKYELHRNISEWQLQFYDREEQIKKHIFTGEALKETLGFYADRRNYLLKNARDHRFLGEVPIYNVMTDRGKRARRIIKGDIHNEITSVSLSTSTM
jgi:hypothetical protein